MQDPHDKAVAPHRRRIRSYVLRTGRMTAGQRQAYDADWGKWGLRCKDGLLDTGAAFGRPGPLVLEIGFGMGQSLLQMATEAPATNFIGIEVHTPGVGKLLHDMDQQDIQNIRIYRHDAVEVLHDCIAEASLDSLQIFFPDPWHKTRHHKRRLIQPDFVALLHTRLKPGGLLHLATDWENYAQQMINVLSATNAFTNTCGAGQYAPRPIHRPYTKFEKRGERLGHGVWDLLFTRAS